MELFKLYSCYYKKLKHKKILHTIINNSIKNYQLIFKGLNIIKHYIQFVRFLLKLWRPKSEKPFLHFCMKTKAHGKK
jgi:hypothetical protein